MISDNDDIIKIVGEHYLHAAHKFLIARQCFNKEFALLSNTDKKPVRAWRNLRLHNTHHLDIIYNMSGFIKQIPYYNMYVSLETFNDGVPFIRMDDIERSQKCKEWNNIALTQVRHQDILLDWDAKSHKDFPKIKESVIKAHKLCNDRGFEHSIIFSGMGFHLVIYKAERYFQGDLLANAKSFFCNKIKSKFLDRSIFTSRRLRKLPYSLSVYDHGVYVCWPFSSIDEFDNFDVEDYNVNNFHKNIYNRFVPVFNQK